MKRWSLLALAALALAGCSESAQSKRFQHEAECNNGLVNDRACTEQKNTEARGKEADQLKEELREYQRLHGE